MLFWIVEKNSWVGLIQMPTAGELSALFVNCLSMFVSIDPDEFLPIQESELCELLCRFLEGTLEVFKGTHWLMMSEDQHRKSRNATRSRISAEEGP